MRAAIFSAPNQCEFVERETPRPDDGQVLVRVKACGLCGTDVHIYRGVFPARFPVIPGHEIAGVVESVGPRVSHLRTGDHVTIDPNINCGTCRPCRRGLVHLCRNLAAIGVTQEGGFATHCLAPARQVHRVPREMSFLVAAMSEPVACCVHGIERAQVGPGDVVLVIGGGMIGLTLLQLARLHGAAATILSELHREKREAARTLGATRVVDPQEEDLSAIVKEATDGAGADVVIEAVGSRATAQQALSLAGDAGRVLFFGVAPEEHEIDVRPFEVYRREITITGSFTNPFTQARAISLLASGRIQVADLVTHQLPLDQLVPAIELVESGHATKVVILPDGAS